MTEISQSSLLETCENRLLGQWVEATQYAADLLLMFQLLVNAL